MNATLDELVEFDSTSAVPDAQGEALVRRDLSVLGHVPVHLEVVVGRATTSVEGLFALKSGSTLALDADLDALVALRLNGKTIARGHLIAVDDNFGFQVTEIV